MNDVENFFNQLKPKPRCCSCGEVLEARGGWLWCWRCYSPE